MATAREARPPEQQEDSPQSIPELRQEKRQSARVAAQLRQLRHVPPGIPKLAALAGLELRARLGGKTAQATLEARRQAKQEFGGPTILQPHRPDRLAEQQARLDRARAAQSIRNARRGS